jgi:hypothetical protein
VTIDELRRAAELLPSGGALTLPREAILEALGAIEQPTQISADLTVAELAARFHRSTATARQWVSAGRFPGAYKLNHRDWRIPLAAIAEFRTAQQAGPRRSASSSASLSAWRRQKAGGRST